MIKTLLLISLVLTLNSFASARITHETLPVFGPSSRIPLTPPSLFDLIQRGPTTPGEFEPATELQMTQATFERMAAQLVNTVDREAKIVVLVSSQSEKTDAIERYRSLGGNPDRLSVWVESYDSIWYQDYGPFYSFDGNHQLISNDFIYDRFGRTNDDAVPEKLAALNGIPNHKVQMRYEGGNFVSDGAGKCFASTRIFQQNPNLTEQQVKDLMKANLGCNDLITLKPLFEDDTYHIDLFAKLVAKNTFIVADLPNDTANKTIMDENTQTLEQLGYQVVRMPVQHNGGINYYTHLNSYLINGYVLLPLYGGDNDQIARTTYENLGYKVLGIDVSDMAGSGGAVHCILRSKPKQ